MKDWIKNNLVKSFSAIGTIIAIVSFLAGVWITQGDITNEIEKLNAIIEIKDKLIDEKIDNAADDVYKDVEKLIQERILTSFYTRLKNEFLTKTGE